MNRKSNLLTGGDIVQSNKKCNKELPEIGSKLFEPSGSWFEESKLENNIDERYSLLKEPRIERDSLLSIAQWDPKQKKVFVLKKKGKEWETYGHHDSKDNLDYLNPEEALFLIESNSLILMYCNVEVSVEISYALLLNAESDCSLEQYRVFSHLSRLGYKLIRHNKPNQNKLIVDSPQHQSVVSENEEKLGDDDSFSNHTSNDDVVVIDDSSSESSCDDVVIVDENTVSKDDVIDILDDDSRDSDLVVLEDHSLVELPLEKWSYMHRNKFISSQIIDDRPVFLDPYIISLSEFDIFNEIPNVKSNRLWLYRPEEMLLPDGIWPFHFKYRIDLNIEKNENFRGRGGFRGRARGRGWYLQRQVNQMKNYTISLMNMVSQLMGSQRMDIIPPPPSLFQGPNHRYHRGYNFQGRGRNQTWGFVSVNNPQRSSNHIPNNTISETVELSDDEESVPQKRTIKAENEDVKPKKIKLESDSISIGSSSSIKLESLDTGEIDVKIETTTNPDVKPTTSLLLASAIVKNEKDKNEIKSEDVSVGNCTGSYNENTQNVKPTKDSEVPMSLEGNNEDTNKSSVSENSERPSEVHSFGTNTSTKGCKEVGPLCGDEINIKEDNGKTKGSDDHPEGNKTTEILSDNHENNIINKLIIDKVDESTFQESTLPLSHLPKGSNNELECKLQKENSDLVVISESNETSSYSRAKIKSDESQLLLPENNTKKDYNEKVSVDNEKEMCISESVRLTDKVSSINMSVDDTKSKSFNECKDISTSKNHNVMDSSSEMTHSDTTVTNEVNSESSHEVQNINQPLPNDGITIENKNQIQICTNPQSDFILEGNKEISKSNKVISEEFIANNTVNNHPLNLDANEDDIQDLGFESKKTYSWKQLKESDKTSTLDSRNKIENQSETFPNEDMDEEQIDLGTPLVQSEHCVSLENILKRLQIFGEYKCKRKECEVNVVYDVYLPNSSYYRHLDPDPDFRLIILRLEDSFPDAEQMINLRRIYNDKRNFLFAVILKESIAYYLYDTVFLPVDIDFL